MVVKKGKGKQASVAQKDTVPSEEGFTEKNKHNLSVTGAQKRRMQRRKINPPVEVDETAEDVRPMSRKYFAVDQGRIAFWFPYKKKEKILTERGITVTDGESGFDCVAEDLAQCTVEEIAQCAPPGYITLRNRSSIEDIAHLFFAIDLDNLTDRVYNLIPDKNADILKSYFMHVTARPKIDRAGMTMTSNPKGGELAGLPPLIQTEDPYVVYMEVEDGTEGAYNPDDFLLPESYRELVPHVRFKGSKKRKVGVNA